MKIGLKGIFKPLAILGAVVLCLSLALAVVPVPVAAAISYPNPTFITRANTGDPATNISIGWEVMTTPAAHSGTDAIHVATTATTTDYAMVGIPTSFVLTENTKISYWGYTVSGDVLAPDEIWLEFSDGGVICNTGSQGTIGQWDEWTLIGSSNWYLPSLTPTPINITDYYNKTVVKVFLGAGSPTSESGVSVNVYLDYLTIDETGDGIDEYTLDDDTDTIEVLCGTFCGYTGCTGIQVGINAALPGDTINVAAGTYTEQLLIQKNLTLVGAGIGQTIVLAPTTGRATAPGYTSQYWTADNWNTDYLLAAYPTDPVNGTTISVKVSGFTFDANGQSHIGGRFTGVYFRKVFNSDIGAAGLFNSEIKGFSTSDTSVTGIRVLESSQLTLSGNLVKDYTILGIVVYGTDNLVDPIVTTTGNTLTPAGIKEGIQYRFINGTGISGEISNNHITNGGNHGIAAVSSDHVLIKNNTIGSGSGNGITIESSSNCTVEGNTVANCSWNGITITNPYSNSDGNLIQGNTISGIHSGNTSSLGSCGWGIGVDASSNASYSVTNTRVIGNNVTASDAGVVFFDVDASNVAHYNKIYDNLYDLGNSNTGVTIDATKNWWGQATGPATGKISGSVNTTPWYATATTTPETEKVTVKRGDIVVAYSDTIQAAIDAASDGDTINVAAGEYDEQVVINKNLTLQGAGDTTVIQPSQTTANSFQLFSRKAGGTNNTASIIVATDTSSVTIKNLKVDGSLVGSVPLGVDNFIGILYRGVGGVIDSVTVNDIGVTQKGSSILLSSMGNTVNVEVKGCNISNFLKGGITADYNGLTANIHDNIVTGLGPSDVSCPNAIEIAYGATGTVTNNRVSNVAYTGTGYWFAYGIIFGDASGTATGNTLTDCQAGIGAEAPYASSHTVTISNNTISAAGLTGVPNVFGINIATWHTDANIVATIKDNDLSAGGLGTGIKTGDTAANEAEGAVNATIEGNDISNWQDGIWLDSTSNEVAITGNTITNNTSVGSGIHIESAVNVANVAVNFNNIVGNQGYGVYNGGTVTLDATNNWWGSPNGPGQDGANGVSANVDYSPWLPGTWETYYDETGAERDNDGDDFSDLQEYWLGTDPNDPASFPGAAVEEVETGYVPANTLLTDVAVIEEVAAVDVDTNTNGAASVTLAEYAGPPAEKSVFGAEVGYIDVHVSTEELDNLDSVTVKLYYDPNDLTVPESSLRIYYWDSATSSWRECSDQSVNTEGNYILATISATTTPDLSYLAGGPFGGGSPSVDIEEGYYKTDDTVNVTVEDSNANQRPFVIETISVTMSSTLPDSLAITLTETGVNTGVFEGTVVLQSPSEGNSTKLAVADGNTITATYDFGDSSITDTAMVDDTAPTITGLTPADGSFVSDNTPYISATLSDAGSGINTDTVVITVDGVDVTTSADVTAGSVSYTPTVALAEGLHNVIVDVSDAVGNAATQAVWSFIVDTELPIVTAVISPDPATTTDTTITFTLTFSKDMDTSVAPTVTFGLTSPYEQHSVAGGWTGGNPKEWVGTFTVSGWLADNDGEQTLKISGAKDLAGNVMGADISNTFMIDTTAPSASAAVRDGLAEDITLVGSASELSANWDAADDGVGSGIAEYQYAIGTTPGGADVVGWTSAGTDTSVTATGLALDEGQIYYFSVQAKDNVGLWSGVTSSNGQKVETQPPALPTELTSTSHDVSEWSADNTVIVTWTDAIDAASGLDGYSIVWDENATTLPGETKDIEEGVQIATSEALADGNSWYFHIRSVDNAGNWNSEAVHLGPFYIDTIGPAISGLIPADGSKINTNTPTISATLSDAGSGINTDTVVIKVDDVDVTTSATVTADGVSYTPTVALADGIHNVTVDVSDNVANVAETAAWSFTVDTAAPTITDLTPANDSFVSDSTPTISATLSDGAGSGIDSTSVVMKVNGEPVEAVYSGGVVSYTPAGALEDDIHNVTVDVSDALGNAATQGWSFTVDTAAPIVTVTSPNGGEVWMGGSTHTITWTATDDNMADNPITLHYSSDGGSNWTQIATGEPNDGSYDWNTSELNGSNFKVKVTAVDKAGNEGSDVSDVVFTIDNTAPSVTVLAPNGGEGWEGGIQKTIRWQASDVHSGVASITLQYSTDNGATWIEIASGLDNSGAYNWVVPYANSNECKVKVIAEDGVGNIGFDTSDNTFVIWTEAAVTTVTVAAPAWAPLESDFTVRINVGQVTNFDSCQFDVSYDPNVIEVTGVTAGNISGTSIPIDGWSLDPVGTQGKVRVLCNVPDVPGVTGEGYLAEIHFRVVGQDGDSSNITLSGGVLYDNESHEIVAQWVNDSINIWDATPGDANRDGLVDAGDVTMVERMILGLDVATHGADANRDGKFDMGDVTAIERIYLGLGIG